MRINSRRINNTEDGFFFYQRNTRKCPCISFHQPSQVFIELLEIMLNQFRFVLLLLLSSMNTKANRDDQTTCVCVYENQHGFWNRIWTKEKELSQLKGLSITERECKCFFLSFCSSVVFYRLIGSRDMMWSEVNCTFSLSLHDDADLN